MIEPNQLLQTYIRQYQAASKKKRKTNSRPRDLSERTNRLFKTLKRTKPTQVTSLSGGMAPPDQKSGLFCVPFAQRCCHKAH